MNEYINTYSMSQQTLKASRKGRTLLRIEVSSTNEQSTGGPRYSRFKYFRFYYSRFWLLAVLKTPNNEGKQLFYVYFSLF